MDSGAFMADEFSKVDIAFQDLKKALSDLNGCRQTPVDVRRNFSAFVNYSQKITSYMRTDYSARTGQKWEALAFCGWNDVTDLFKEIRRIEEHEDPVILRINYTWSYDREINGELVSMQVGGYWEWDNPLEEFHSDELKVYDRPPEDKGAVEIKPKKIEYEYVLSNQDRKIVAWLDSIGYADIHKLSESCFEILETYCHFYNEKVSENSGAGGRT